VYNIYKAKKGAAMHVGEIIRNFRKEKDMTLLGLSQRSGVALATLSRIENGKMTGTLQSHMKICEAFEITLPELYRDLPSSKKIVEVQTKRAKTGVFVHNKKSSYEILVSNALNKKILPALIRISDGGSTASEETKPGVERFIYMLDGKVEAAIGEERYNLTRGDTLYFAASVPHYFKNTGNGEARILTVTGPPA